jgi:hypothetical protein
MKTKKSVKSSRSANTKKVSRTSKSKKSNKFISSISRHLAFVIVVLAVAVGGTVYLVASHADSPSYTCPSGYTLSGTNCTKASVLFDATETQGAGGSNCSGGTLVDNGATNNAPECQIEETTPLISVPGCSPPQILSSSNGTAFCYYPAQPNLPDPVSTVYSCPGGYTEENSGSGLECVQFDYSPATTTMTTNYSCPDSRDTLTNEGGGEWACTSYTTIPATLSSATTVTTTAPVTTTVPKTTTVTTTAPVTTTVTTTKPSTPTAPVTVTTSVAVNNGTATVSTKASGAVASSSSSTTTSLCITSQCLSYYAAVSKNEATASAAAATEKANPTPVNKAIADSTAQTAAASITYPVKALQSTPSENVQPLINLTNTSVQPLTSLATELATSIKELSATAQQTSGTATVVKQSSSTSICKETILPDGRHGISCSQ